MTSPTAHALLPSPLGPVHLIATNSALRGIYWPSHHGSPPREPCIDAPHPILDAAARQLREYFAGQRRTFTIALDPLGTEFQHVVWDALARIPFGEHRTYSSLAAVIGRPRAVRAVASANARNPLSIIVPCHRVIGIDGGLRGYAGGLEAKRWLLDHEGGSSGCPS